LVLQEDVMRLKRLMKAEREMHVEDEQRGGQQENVLLELQRQVSECAAPGVGREQRRGLVLGLGG
jgi:hypothetical protein